MVALRHPGYKVSWSGKSKINNTTVINTNLPCICNIDINYLAIPMLNRWMAAQCRPWSIWYIISGGWRSNINNFTIINTNLIELNYLQVLWEVSLASHPVPDLQIKRDSEVGPGEISIPVTPIMNMPDIPLLLILFTYNTKGSMPEGLLPENGKVRRHVQVQHTFQYLVKWPRTIWSPSVGLWIQNNKTTIF